MSIQLLVKFKVKEDKVDAFLQMMEMAKSRIGEAEGCEGVDVLQSETTPTLVFLSEKWQSNELHDVYAAKMRESGSLNSMADFLDGQPESETYLIR